MFEFQTINNRALAIVLGITRFRFDRAVSRVLKSSSLLGWYVV